MILVLLFQFHKVRLKANKAQLQLLKNPLFQFHKVRLKVLSARKKDIRNKFQFHKVRLKDAMMCFFSLAVKSFNSIRYD